MTQNYISRKNIEKNFFKFNYLFRNEFEYSSPAIEKVLSLLTDVAGIEKSFLAAEAKKLIYFCHHL